jgi:hypothetical protein
MLALLGGQNGVYPKNPVAFDSQKVREVVKAVCLLLFGGHENSRNLLVSSAQMLVFRKAATQLPEDLSLSLFPPACLTGM